MESIEEIDALFSGIQYANQSANQWYIESIPSLSSSRILLSRSSSEENCLFIKGKLESFGRLPSLASLEYREAAVDAQTGEEFPALRISAPAFPQGNNAIVHIVYELIRQLVEDPLVDNASLLRRIGWIIELLGRKGAPMSPDHQRGLAAECLLLAQLLMQGRKVQISPESVIDKWVQGERDFNGGGISIEVKSTSAATRRHHISSLSQLDIEDLSQEVFIYSVGLRHDPSASMFLPDYLRAVEEQLVSSNDEQLPVAFDAFANKLSGAGYQSDHEGLYRSGDGILQSTLLPPRLFRVQDINRMTINNFKNNSLPPGVVSVSYEIEIFSDPLSRPESESVLEALVSASS